MPEASSFNKPSKYRAEFKAGTFKEDSDGLDVDDGRLQEVRVAVGVERHLDEDERLPLQNLGDGVDATYGGKFEFLARVLTGENDGEVVVAASGHLRGQSRG